MIGRQGHKSGRMQAKEMVWAHFIKEFSAKIISTPFLPRSPSNQQILACVIHTYKDKSNLWYKYIEKIYLENDIFDVGNTAQRVNSGTFQNEKLSKIPKRETLGPVELVLKNRQRDSVSVLWVWWFSVGDG